MSESNHVQEHRSGFGPGLTELARHEQLQLAVLRLQEGEEHRFKAETETALLLMEGNVSGTVSSPGREQLSFGLDRKSLFDESASCIHVCARTEVVLAAKGEVEFTIYRCNNQNRFSPRLYTPEEVPNEHRGAGQVAGRCLRFVRTIFDRSNAPDAAELVLGEVVNLPGGWSSYPPHHHAQPEIYHYRFTEPQGFGHAELGEQVFKVRQYDTLKIPAGLDHAQCSAPGYGMYYSWVIRHLPGDPYTVPDFTEEHRWTMESEAGFWWPEDIARNA